MGHMTPFSLLHHQHTLEKHDCIVKKQRKKKKPRNPNNDKKNESSLGCLENLKKCRMTPS